MTQPIAWTFTVTSARLVSFCRFTLGEGHEDCNECAKILENETPPICESRASQIGQNARFDRLRGNFPVSDSLEFVIELGADQQPTELKWVRRQAAFLMTCLAIWILTAGCLAGPIPDEDAAAKAAVENQPAVAFVNPDSPAPADQEVDFTSFLGGRAPGGVQPGSLPSVLFPDSYPETLFDSLRTLKQVYKVPIRAEAWHWQHQNTGGPLGSGYGIPTIRGTLFWSLKADPEMDCNPDGFIKKIGMHSDLRLREQEKYRSYYPGSVWLWELYAWADTPVGRVKAGQIWRRFGLDWDGSFFGSVMFYDGFMMNPDYGLSWENTWTGNLDFKVDSFAQFFIAQDGINGSLAGTDSESLVGSTQKNTGIVRLIPTWTLSDDSTVALGLSGLTGEIVNNPAHVSVPNQVLGAWAVDLTYTKSRWKVFAEALQCYGVRNPVRFVSGGPSNRTTDVLAGIHYRLGPATYRVTYSAGFDDNPYGWQRMWVPGVTIALTKNIDFYAEWVRWDVYNNATAAATNGHREVENGVSLVINWRY